MAKVKCRCCGASIDKKIAVAIKHGKTNWYYCPEHVGQPSPRDKMFMLAQEIFGKTTHTMFFSGLDKIAVVHTYEKMVAYMEDNRQYLERIMSREFVSEYAKTRYFITVIGNSIHDFRMKQPEVKKEIALDIDMVSTVNYKKKEVKKGLDSLLDELLDD